LGAEISKNLILSGVSQITLYDNSIVSENDLSTNFFVIKEDIDNNSRADVTQRGLMELNNSAIVMTYKGELANDFSILNDYNIVVITEIINLEIAETLNQYCRNKKIGFVYTAEFGLSSFLFSDFGEDFIVEDLTGLECEKYYIKSITNGCPGIVEIDPIEEIKNGKKVKKYLKLGTGDFVTFKDITGMTELNDTPPRAIRVISPTKFTIEDTSKFQEFTGVGIVEEVKVPRPSIFKPLSEAINVIYYEDVIEEYLNEDVGSIASKISTDMTDEILLGNIGNNNKKSLISNQINNEEKNDIPWIKMFYSSYQNESMNNLANEKMHLAMITLHEFFNIHQYLPNYNDKKEIDECIEISLKVLSKSKDEGSRWAINLQKIDKIFLEKIFKFSKYYYTPFTCFLGGVISEEIIKYIGLYKPTSQWMYFNFLELIEDDIMNENISEIKENDKEKLQKEKLNIMYFSKNIMNELKNINILIIGLNDVGYEILRIFIMLNLLEQKGNINILDDNKAEVDEKLKELKSLDKNYNISIIPENININMKLSEKEWWKNSNIIINSLPFSINAKEKLFIIKNSKKYNKILIDINTNRSIGSCELILPKSLLNGDKKNGSDLCFYEEEETPDGEDEIEDNDNSINEEENLNKIIVDENEDESLGYKSISTLEESLKWSREYFENNFILYIKYLNELINKSDSEQEMLKYIDNLISKEKDSEKILKLIRTFKKLITLRLGMNFETVVFHSIETFQELFEFSTDEILQKFPSDLLIKGTIKKFWSGARKEPKRIIFDINNDEHFQFIYCYTYLVCEILNMDDLDNKMKSSSLKKAAEKYELKKFDMTILKKVKLKDFYTIEKFSLLQFLKASKKGELHFKELNVNYKDKIEDFNNFQNTNKQLNLIILASNIKLGIYGLSERYKSSAICSLLKINDFHPMVSSSISGLSVIQLFNLLNDEKIVDFIKEGKENKDNKIEENEDNKNENNKINEDKNKNNISCFRNTIFNLSDNIYLWFDLNNSI